jgi:tetratricopeptide (TPR) repeat protein
MSSTGSVPQSDLSAWRGGLPDGTSAPAVASAADAALERRLRAAAGNPRLQKAAAALNRNDIPVAEALLRPHLKEYPTDVAAIRMLAEVAARLERYGDAANLLARALELAPAFRPARHNYATVLHRMNRHEESLEQAELLLADDPRDLGARNLKAAALCGIGRYEQAISLYAGVLEDVPHQPRLWLNYGHALKTVGRREECIAAYRRALEYEPGLGVAWFSLANLKTFRFTAQEIAAMRGQLARTDIGGDDRLHLEFALGKALEDCAEYGDSFAHYAAGNALRRATIEHSPHRMSARVQRSKALLTSEFFAARAGFGAEAPDPIFIVGLPRAGSTLLEQILSSHSAIEGTMELPDIPALVSRLIGSADAEGGASYPAALADLTAAECRALGEEYLRRTRIQRRTTAPFFIDKMPNNFQYVGLIQLILPNARIIDARRHPLGCCFSAFKQHFARGQSFTYGLEDVGRFYHDYVELMAHFDEVLPGRVHRVFYESLVADPETEVRRLLEHCGLSFEAGCLRHHENERAVRTASSEQVRQPIFRDAVEHWRHYERWLGPLKTALGAVLDSYPATPAFRRPDPQ